MPLLPALSQAAPRTSTEPDPPLTLRWIVAPDGSARSCVEVGGWTPARLQELEGARLTHSAWQHAFPVYATSGNLTTDIALPPMLGTYEITNKSLRFTARWPLQPGVGYRAVFWPDRLPGPGSAQKPSPPLHAILELPRLQDTPPTHIVAVQPETEVVPENLLKFYVHFSAPMSRGRSYEHIFLTDSDGRTLELPFLELAEELWDPAQRRLTLFIDPGRIKREVKPLEDLGPVFVEGRHYTLTITNTWLDANGRTLAATHTKRFRVGPADRTPPDPHTWDLKPPTAGSHAAMRVDFREPMDPALAVRLLAVLEPKGTPVSGQARIESAGRIWSFTPDAPWTPGAHTLLVPSQIEDLAGNNVGKPFEVDLFDPVTVQPATTATRIAFLIH